MDFDLTEDQVTIRDAVRELAGKFDDQYWMDKDAEHEFPREFYDAFARGGWLGITDKYWLAALIPEGKNRITDQYRVIQQSGVDIYDANFIGGLKAVALPAEDGGRLYLPTLRALPNDITRLKSLQLYSIGLPNFDIAIRAELPVFTSPEASSASRSPASSRTSRSSAAFG